ncbi:MAG: hypothetical protein ACE5GM_11195 [bacterium]
MALSKSSLKSRIITELAAQGFVTSGEHAWTEKFATAIANAIVDEIQQNAEVATSVVGTCPTGAVTGSGTGVVN